MSTERAVPFYCPYCGEEDLRPVERPHGAWRCAGCLRSFAVTLVGIGAPAAVLAASETGTQVARPDGATREVAP